MVISSAILLGFADSTKNGWQVGWVEVRNPTKDIGMLYPTYEKAVADVRTKPKKRCFSNAT
jgi:hypothetical protein